MFSTGTSTAACTPLRDQALGALHHESKGRVAPRQDAGGAVGDVRIVVDEHVQMLLIGLRIGAFDDLDEQVRRGHGAHAPDDADDFSSVYQMTPPE